MRKSYKPRKSYRTRKSKQSYRNQRSRKSYTRKSYRSRRSYRNQRGGQPESQSDYTLSKCLVDEKNALECLTKILFAYPSIRDACALPREVQKKTGIGAVITGKNGDVIGSLTKEGSVMSVQEPFPLPMSTETSALPMPAMAPPPAIIADSPKLVQAISAAPPMPPQQEKNLQRSILEQLGKLRKVPLPPPRTMKKEGGKSELEKKLAARRLATREDDERNSPGSKESSSSSGWKTESPESTESEI
jgi:hypothetical protein